MELRLKCICKHEFQDSTYGAGVRVATPTTRSKLDGKITLRCTVCNKEQEVKKK